MAARLRGDGDGSSSGVGDSGGGDGGGSSSGGSGGGSSSSSPPPELLPTAKAVPIPEEVNASSTLGANARMLMQATLARPLSAAEVGQLDTALATALSVLSADGDDANRRLLSSSMATALLSRGAAQLWACTLEVLSREPPVSVAAFGSSLVTSASATAGALFTAALDL